MDAGSGMLQQKPTNKKYSHSRMLLEFATIFLERNKTGFAHSFLEIAHYCDLILKVEENVRHIKSGYFN